MRYYKLVMTAKHGGAPDIDAVEEYLGCLYKNGQVVDYDSIYVAGRSVCCNATLPEADSLSEKNENEYVARARAKAEETFAAESVPLGDNWHLDACACRCARPSRYLLICDPLHAESPVTCGDCGAPVPLYRLPAIFGEKDHYAVREFERDARAVEQLWMSGLYDRVMFRQRNSAHSQLSKRGRKICQAYEKATGVPFYYHMPFDLLTFFDEKGDGVQRHPTPDRCPCCQQNWRAPDDPVVRYRCAPCRLTANDNEDP